jgi:NodT family efflux transporter outer membrane factor (OMF) lipoprotein
MAALALSACTTVGEDFVSPQTGPTPGGYAMAGDAASPRVVPGATAAGPWWMSFGSAELDAVIRQALANSPSLEEAQAVLERHQASEAAARAMTLPQVGINARTERQLFNSQSFGFTGFPNRIFNLFSIGGVVSYDFDLFGENRRRVEEAGAQRERAERQADAAALMLSANVALEAVRLAGLNAELEAMDLVLSDDRKLLELAGRAEKLGGLSRSGVVEIEAQLAQDLAQIPALTKARDLSRHQLALLSGKAPAEWTPPDFRLDNLKVPGSTPVALPSELVHRRPDILAAEADLHAATAAAGVARADEFPKLRLGSSYAQSSTELDSLFDSQAKGWSVNGGISVPIFDGGLRKANLKAAQADLKAAQARYRRTVLSAFTQVSDLLSALENDEARVVAIEREVALAQQDADITAAGVRLGGTPLLRAIDARRHLSQARRSLAQARANRLQDLIGLYSATASDWRTAADD